MATDPARQDDNAEESRRQRPSPGVGLHRRPMTVFLVALVLFMIAMPFAEKLADPGLLEGLLLTIVLISGVVVVGGRRNMLVLATLLALTGLGAKWLHHFRPDLIAPGVYLVPAILLFVVVTLQLLRYILRAPRVDAEVLSAGVATYLVLGLMWGLAYLLTASIVPNAFVLAGDTFAGRSFNGFHAFYFSLVTLSTVGYGDIVPAIPVARMLAALESIVGVLYVAVLVARLVTLYTDKRE